MTIRRNSSGARYVHNLLNKEVDERRARFYRLIRRWKAEGKSEEEIIRLGRAMI